MKTCPFKGKVVSLSCEEEDCAWWDDVNKSCVIKTIAKFLYQIKNKFDTTDLIKTVHKTTV